MDTSEFFKNQNDLSFENYFKTTHKDWQKDSLASVHAILYDYIQDVKNLRQQRNPVAARLKTLYSDTELSRMVKNKSESPQPSIYNNYISDITTEQFNIVQGSKQDIIMLDKGSSGQKRSREQTPEQPPTSTTEAFLVSTSEQPSISTSGKRNCRRAADKNFVCSDDDTNSDLTSSPSSFFPSDLANTPVGYTCIFEMCELKDVPDVSLPITNPHFATLEAEAKKKSDENKLFPTDSLSRLHASAIFEANGSFLGSNEEDGDDFILPENIHANIRAFERAIQKHTLYIQSHASTTLEQIALNSIITTTFLLHGKPRIKTEGSETNLVASSVSTFLSPLFSTHDQIQVDFDATSWAFKQQDDFSGMILRPDIIFSYQLEDEVVEIGCGEVKKPGVSQYLVEEDKMRVLEVMKRQLHLRLCRARKEYEAMTFGVLIQGTTVILLKMRMDLENSVYMYHEEKPFTLPTTYHTHTHMSIALEVAIQFKEQMLSSLLRVEDYDFPRIWDLYKPHVRPTVSSFDPIYYNS